ncbi:tRNA (adenine-N(1)-)-methyltransferase catalytic subunit trm61 [Rhizophlyctis rosea]|uniref:tRNA (adenine(58)-N(1))-methyltransferase catalytic subunit TRM61 n=1 Tax=Rhizophlyctis rosea TaxID=64517 RepID=A0AAD5SCV5_9FUNG|nr:tRNA (adenine-N(1)-)-methyltransferase catalytic subunit trm61 [Rhizophlyctis rosea]
MDKDVPTTREVDPAAEVDAAVKMELDTPPAPAKPAAPPKPAAESVTLLPTFRNWSRYIQKGDTVLAFMSPSNMDHFVVTESGNFNNAYGKFEHAKMVGKEWGSKMPSTTGKGFIYLMYPSPELWTLALPHRTQILYMPDIAFVSSFLELKPGVKMIESGTGSGSFSHSIARTIAPTGHLYTFEYSQDRYQKAAAEFKDHGLGDLITIQCRDVCKNGFDMENAVTAVFLDLPSPWEAIPSAKKAFKKKRVGRLCSFSPCVEQVIKTCTALKEQGFVDIRMYETLLKPYEFRSLTMKPLPQPRLAPTPTIKVEPSISSTTAPDQNGEGSNKRKRLSKDESGVESESKDGSGEVYAPKDVVVTKGASEMRAHTSYLTFATLLPDIS